MKIIKLCKEDGCRQPVRAKGLCIAHYSSLRYAEALDKSKARREAAKPLKKPRSVLHCSKEGCGNISHAKGLCKCHYNHAFGYDRVKKRKKINPVSSKRRAWNDKYYAQVERDAPYQSPVDQPDKLYGKDNHYKIQRHHPYRRTNDLILCFCYISSEFHAWIESHATEARKMGWIKDGPPEPEDIRPWPESCEINHQWPEHHRRNKHNI